MSRGPLRRSLRSAKSQTSSADKPTDARGARQLVNALAKDGYKVTGIDDHWKCECPFHDDNEPSLLIDVRTDSVGRRATFVRCIECRNIAMEAIDHFQLPRGEVLYGNPQKPERAKYLEPLTEAKVERYADYLSESPKLLAYLKDERGLNDETIRKYEIGYDEQRDRYVLPVRDEPGTVVNLRRYLPHPPPGSPKMKNASGRGHPPRLYPSPALPRRSKRGVIVCEGEWDCLLLRQHGFLAVTGTHGAGTWVEAWTAALAARRVALVYDVGATTCAQAAAETLLPTCASVRVVDLPMPHKGDDVTDWFVTYGRTADELRQLIRSVAPLGGQGVGS